MSHFCCEKGKTEFLLLRGTQRGCLACVYPHPNQLWGQIQYLGFWLGVGLTPQKLTVWWVNSSLGTIRVLWNRSELIHWRTLLQQITVGTVSWVTQVRNSDLFARQRAQMPGPPVPTKRSLLDLIGWGLMFMCLLFRWFERCSIEKVEWAKGQWAVPIVLKFLEKALWVKFLEKNSSSIVCVLYCKSKIMPDALKEQTRPFWSKKFKLSDPIF